MDIKEAEDIIKNRIGIDTHTITVDGKVIDPGEALSIAVDAIERVQVLEYAHNMQESIIKQLEKSNQELSDRIVKNEGLMSSHIIK